MKATRLCYALGLLLAFTACLPELREDAAGQAADRMAAAIPTDIHLRLLAVAPVEGDTDGAVERALVSRLSDDPRFRLVEREQQAALLEEQSRQLSAAVEPESRIELGRMLGAEGLVLVRVLSSRPGFLSARLQVHFRLDDLQRGTIAAAEQEITVEAPLPYRREAGGALGVLGLCGAATGVWVSRRGKSRARRELAQQDRLGDIRQELREARRRIEEARSGVVGTGDSARAIRIDDSVRALRDLEQRLDQVPAAVLKRRRSALEKGTTKASAAARELERAIGEAEPSALERCAADVERLAAEAAGYTR